MEGEMKRRYVLIPLLALAQAGCAMSFNPLGGGVQPSLRLGSGCSMLGNDPLAEPMERYATSSGFFSAQRAMQAYQSLARASFAPNDGRGGGGLSVSSCSGQAFTPLRP
jgi:hypothetical protein